MQILNYSSCCWCFNQISCWVLAANSSEALFSRAPSFLNRSHLTGNATLLKKPLKKPLANDWLTWGYKGSLTQGWNNLIRWAGSLSLRVYPHSLSSSYLVSLTLPLQNYLLKNPCLRLCFQKNRCKTMGFCILVMSQFSISLELF